MVPSFDPEKLQARWVLGGIDPEDLVRQALVALEQGYTGIALQQLAGLMRPTLSDLGTLPDRAFAEMGLKAINREQAVDLILTRRAVAPNEIMLSLLNTFPAFMERWRKHIEEWRGEQAGSYNDMAEFVHFVVDDLYETGNLSEVGRVFHMMERLLAEGDQETRDLIGLGFFETLQNVTSWRPYGNKAFEQFLGPVSQRAWAEIQSTWADKSSLAEVIRAERRTNKRNI